MTWCFWRWGFWIRTRWGGVSVRRAKGYVPLFSERYGYRKAHYWFGLRIEFLKRGHL